MFCWQGFPECAEDEIVSVPDAKYTKGEFEVTPLVFNCCVSKSVHDSNNQKT